MCNVSLGQKSHVFLCNVKFEKEVDVPSEGDRVIEEVEETWVENAFHGRYKVSTHGFLLVCCSTVGQQQRLEAGVLSDAL